MPKKGYEKKSSRPGTRHLKSLFPEVVTDNDDDKAEAFIGRFMRATNGLAYEMFAEPYCKTSDSYDLMNSAIKKEYKRSVINNNMDAKMFFRCICWLLENMMDINQYTMSRVVRQCELGTLPYGKYGNLRMSTVNEIAYGKK